MKPNSVKLDERLDPDALNRLTAADLDMDGVLGSLGGKVDVRWRPSPNPDAVAVELEYENVRGEAEISRSDLGDPLQYRRRLRQVWDRVLSQKIESRLNALDLSGAEIDGL